MIRVHVFEQLISNGTVMGVKLSLGLGVGGVWLCCGVVVYVWYVCVGMGGMDWVWGGECVRGRRGSGAGGGVGN